MSPSVTRSFTPVSVTVCGMFQSALVKVSVRDGPGIGDPAEEINPSAVLELATGTVTFEVGTLVSLTVNDAVPPDSVVIKPDVGVTLNPETSSSAIVTVAVDGFTTV